MTGSIPTGVTGSIPTGVTGSIPTGVTGFTPTGMVALTLSVDCLTVGFGVEVLLLPGKGKRGRVRLQGNNNLNRETRQSGE